MDGNVTYIAEDIRKRYEALTRIDSEEERKSEKSKLESSLGEDLLLIETIL